MQLFKSTSALNGANANFVEDLYEQYLNDPDSVDEQWREKFQSIRSSAETVDIPHSSIKKHFSDLAKAPTGVRVIQGGLSSEQLAKQAAVSRLVFDACVLHAILSCSNLHFHVNGIAQTDPLP